MKRIFAILLASLIAGMFMGYDSARAANPSFIGWKVTQITTEGKAFKISIKYTNNSNNKIVTAFFKKDVSISSSFANGISVKGGAVSNKVNKVELYPGQSHVTHYRVQFAWLTCGSIGQCTKANPTFENSLKTIIKNMKVSHTFNASSKGL